MSGQESASSSDERSSRLEEIYERVLELTPARRMAFLKEACDEDRELEQELRSLLEHREAAESFFSGLANTVVSLAIGEEVHHYRLTGILGTGGMGTVYRAHDTRLGRMVALKFLPPYLNAHTESRERFLVEARAAAALDHPNVCSIHEIGETTDGRPFIAMACYEGETLKARLSRGPLPPDEALDIAVQLARGLSAAHARGIVHRDVKPGNIMLTGDGQVRLLDFGVAKVSDVSLTAPGSTPGTIAYMSPEQARGDVVGPATDVWSLGVVLYEMLAGARPFRGGNDRTIIQAILNDQPDLDSRPLRTAPRSTLRVLERLLEKEPGNRFSDAGAALHDLTRRTRAGRAERALDWARTHPRPLAAASAALAGIVAVVALVRPVRQTSALASGADASAQPAIAILPFTVRGAGLDVWREGMVDLLSMGLDGAANLRAVDSRTLLAAWHQDVGDQATADLARALGVARKTSARFALVGSVIKAGERMRLAADVYDVGRGTTIGPVQVDGPSDSVLALVDRLGMQTLGLIFEKDSSELPALNLAAITTPSLVALKAYLEGDAQYRHSEFRAASEAWERAVRADTLFALAYLGLADSYAWYSFEPFQKNLTRAERMAARLPERERTRVQMRWARFTGDPEAFSLVRTAVRKYPDAADAWYQLGEVYFHDASAMLRPAEAEAAFRKAAELQPTMAPYRTHLMELAFTWRADSAHIAREVEAYRRLAPEDPRTRAGRLALALAFGDSGARAVARAAIDTLDAPAAFQVYRLLEHPRFASVRDAVFPAVLSRLDGSDRTSTIRSQLMNLGFVDGRLRQALAVLADTATPALLRSCGAFYYQQRGLPVPRAAVEQGQAVIRADSSLLSTVALGCAADYAARIGDWNEHVALIARGRALAARALTAGDSATAQFWHALANASEGYGLMRRGQKAEALRSFESCLARGGPYSPQCLWFVGRLALELGKLEEAERAFRSLWSQQDAVPARMQLARILERTNRPDEAREMYQYVVYAWRHADPELQPVVEEARQAVIRLTSASRM